MAAEYYKGLILAAFIYGLLIVGCAGLASF